MHLVAKTYQGLESLLADEIKKLGAQNVQEVSRAVLFEGDKELLYRANYTLRTALRILVKIFEFEARNEEQLYLYIKKFDWEKCLSADDTFAIDAVVNSEYFTHSHFVALKVKDGIADWFRERTGVRPSVDTNFPNVKINVHISDTKVTVSLDSSGESLHIRNYKVAKVHAPLSEVMAAALVLLSNWEKNKPLADPFCGSGTILTEAAMIAMNMPCQINRKLFGFMSWRNFDNTLWQKVIRQAKSGIDNDISLKIVGFDNQQNAVIAAQKNIAALGLQDKISVHRKSFELLEPPFASGIIITNPPYHERLKDENDEALYGEIGSRLKHFYSGYSVWIFSGFEAGIKAIGLKPSKKIKLLNGAIECKFLQFELYAGSKKDKSVIN